MVAAAVIGSAVVGGAVSSRSSSKASKAQVDSTNSANSTQLQAQRESIAFQQKQSDRARADNAPWLQAGTNALNQLTAMPNFTGASVATDPGYQFGLSEGMKGVTNSAAARGGLLSGAALKAASQYNTDYSTTKFNDAFQRDATNKNRLASIAGVGQTAASSNAASANNLGSNVANGMLNTGNQIAGNQIGAGNARASGYVGQGNAVNGAMGSAWNMYQGNQLMNALGNRSGYQPNAAGAGSNPYAGYDAAASGGWGIE